MQDQCSPNYIFLVVAPWCHLCLYTKMAQVIGDGGGYFSFIFLCLGTRIWTCHEGFEGLDVEHAAASREAFIGLTAKCGA